MNLKPTEKIKGRAYYYWIAKCIVPDRFLIITQTNWKKRAMTKREIVRLGKDIEYSHGI